MKKCRIYNLYGFIYFRIKQKHPTWAPKQIKFCASYAYRRANQRKIKNNTERQLAEVDG